MNIQRIHSEDMTQIIPNLAVLLQDAVASGASIGFLIPFTYDDALS